MPSGLRRGGSRTVQLIVHVQTLCGEDPALFLRTFQLLGARGSGGWGPAGRKGFLTVCLRNEAHAGAALRVIDRFGCGAPWARLTNPAYFGLLPFFFFALR